MINRLEFLIMFFGFTILDAIKPHLLTTILAVICGVLWCWYWVDDWNYQDDYEEDN